MRGFVSLIMTVRGIKEALWRTGEDVGTKHTLQMAAALSYYYVLSIFPALIFLSAVVAYLPVANVFDQSISLIGRLMPPASLALVRKVLAEVITPNRGTGRS